MFQAGSINSTFGYVCASTDHVTSAIYVSIVKPNVFTFDSMFKL